MRSLITQYPTNCSKYNLRANCWENVDTTGGRRVIFNNLKPQRQEVCHLHQSARLEHPIAIAGRNYSVSEQCKWNQSLRTFIILPVQEDAEKHKCSTEETNYRC